MRLPRLVRGIQQEGNELLGAMDPTDKPWGTKGNA